MAHAWGTGDIAIQIKGLRPGEKLYEELLVSGNAKPTRHPKILSAEDNIDASPEEILNSIVEFSQNPQDSAYITARLVEFNIGYTPTP